jgi:hypothetical protein
VNRKEAVALTRYVKACCPQQQIDDYTPQAWFGLLSDLDAGDCQAAITTLGQRQPFIAPAEIRDEVKRIRTGRLDGFQYVPVEGDGNPKVYLAARREQIEAVASGRRPADPAAITADPAQAEAVKELCGPVFRRPR